jgi:hypothetical protein
MTTPNAAPDAAERARRTEFIRDAKTACANGETLDRRTAAREKRADEWAKWLRRKMDDIGCTDPTELLPDILAKLDQTIDDRVAAATREINTAIRKAMT